ncbi:49_t:CDS:1, partial [Gigaspora margarita]
ASIDQQIHQSIPVYRIVENKLNQLPSQPLLFNHLTKIREIVYIDHKQSPKQKYSFGMGYAKKALNYAV